MLPFPPLHSRLYLNNSGPIWGVNKTLFHPHATPGRFIWKPFLKHINTSRTTVATKALLAGRSSAICAKNSPEVERGSTQPAAKTGKKKQVLCQDPVKWRWRLTEASENNFSGCWTKSIMVVISGILSVIGWVLSQHTTISMLVLPLGSTQNKDTCKGFRVLVWISNPPSSRWGSPKPKGGNETSPNLRKQERVTGLLAHYSVC